MAYYNGQATSNAELLNILLNYCANHGWLKSENLLKKNNAAFLFSVNANSDGITLKAGTDYIGSSLINPSPNTVATDGIPGLPLAIFPVEYFLHITSTEVYLIYKHSIDVYHWLAFGVTNNNQFWFAASRRWQIGTSWQKITMLLTGGDSLYACPAPFWNAGTWQANSGYNSYVYDTELGWAPTATIYNDGSSIAYKVPLISRAASAWSSETILIPISCFKVQASSKVSLICDLQDSRYIRLNNYEPGQIITLGNDRWVVYPFYKKNTATPDGGVGIDHSGTFGWAIRYDGP